MKHNAKQPLSTLLEGLPVHGDPVDVWVSGLALHSGQIKTGEAFFAYAGEQAHGVRYVEDALEKGAAAVVVDEVELMHTLQGQLKVPVVAVDGLRRHLSLIAARFYAEPSRRLNVVGITGTNGKTSCSQFLGQMLARHHQQAFIIGTLGNGFYGQLAQAQLTTPDAFQIQSLLQTAVDGGAGAAVMEVSSHALQQHRADAVDFDVAVFTNLSQDHLDYHGNMANYLAAKKRLFFFEALQYAVINVDDPAGREISQLLPAGIKQLRYATVADDAELTASVTKRHRSGMQLDVKTPQGSFSVHTQLIGGFNVSNILAVMGVLHCLGWSWQAIVEAVPAVDSIAGRLERFGGDGLPVVMIDYAHTPDALKQVLAALREHRHQQGELICVFGCGGNRDRGKRPKMGEVAERFADSVVLTDDNPREEDSGRILDDILKGISGRDKVRIVADRKSAIKFAIQNANPNDMVLIAGKGHEDYQIIGKQRLPFSDKQEVLRCLKGLAA